MGLTDFRSLGRSGLIVSPLALGTMTFGAKGYGSADDVSAAVFNAYVDAGGNFVDTADIYGGGRSEELVGRSIAGRSLRDAVVLATKFTWNQQPGNPNAGGNGRKNIHRALDASLRRLGTDYVDLYWMHFWDQVTPAEEVVQSFGQLVQSGKIRYWGLSDTPAWYAAKAAALARAQGIPGFVALQEEYSVAERRIEAEHVPAALDAGLGLCTWGPLAAGFLTGKYGRDGGGVTGEGRFTTWKPFRTFTDRHWDTLATVKAIAAEGGHTPAAVAIAWAVARPGIATVLLGASTAEQLQGNLRSLEVRLTPAQLGLLDAASAPDTMFTAGVKRSIFGGTDVRGWA